jgi:hypothetical protein
MRSSIEKSNPEYEFSANIPESLMERRPLENGTPIFIFRRTPKKILAIRLAFG